MSAIDNGNWLRSFLATQLGTAQNNMMPMGEAWKQYQDYVNSYLPLLQQGSGNANSMLWGQSGIPGVNDKIASQYDNLSNKFNSMVGSTQGSKDLVSQLLDAVQGKANYSGAWMNEGMNGSGQLNDVYNTALSQTANPYNQNLGDIGSYLMSSLGQNPYNTGASDMGMYGLKQGGWTPQLSSGYGNVMSQLVNTGGMTPGVQQGMAQGQGLMGQGMGMVGQGQNWTNPYLTGGSNAAMDIIGNGGNTPQLAGIQDFTFGNMAGGDYGQLQPGFDFANKLMQGGGLSKYTTGGGDLAMMYAMGGGPSIAPSGFSMPNIGGINAMAGFTPGADVSAGPVDSGYTQSLNDTLAKANKILDANPLMNMQTAVSMARNDAATSVIQQNEAMMRKALQRGGGPGSTVANGLANRGMAEYADSGAQAEAKAMRDQANTQQGLQLQKYGIGADLAKAMEQVAAQRNSSSSSLAGQVASANAGIHAANASASGNVAAANASIQAQLAKAQMDLYGQMAGLNVQRQMTGLNDLVNFGGQANDQMKAGLNALPNLQQAGNQRYQTDMDAYMKAAGLQSQNLATGFSGLGNLQQTQTQGQANRMSTGADLTNIGAGMFNNSNSIASNNLTKGLDLIGNYQGVANQGVGAWGNVLSNAQNNQKDWATLGAGMTQNNIGNTQNAIGLMNNAATNNNTYKTQAGQLGNSMWNTEINGLDTAFKNNLGINQFGLNSFNALNGAENQNIDAQSKNSALMASILANNNTGFSSLISSMMNYLNTAQAGYYGINPNAGGQPGWLASLAQAGISGAAGAAAGMSDIRLKDNVEDMTDGLEEIEKLRPVTWTWKADGGISQGLIAQEVAEVMPNLVTSIGDGDLKGIKYTELIPVLIKAVQELKKEIDELKGKN